MFPASLPVNLLQYPPSFSFRSLSTSAETQRSGTLSQLELQLECLLHLEPLWVRKGQSYLISGYALWCFVVGQAGEARPFCRHGSDVCGQVPDGSLGSV